MLGGFPYAGKRAVVLSEQGRGDQARAIAICAALKAAEPDTDITLIAHYDGTLAKRDMAWHARTCGVVDAYIEAHPVGGRVKQRMSTADLVQTLLPHCAVLYDAMPLAVKTYYQRGVLLQHDADLRLAPYRILYDGHPFDAWRLKYLHKTWAELASETTGLEVRADDLSCAAPLTCAPLPERGELPPWDDVDALVARSGSDDADLIEPIIEGKPYVVIHAGAGGDCAVKVMPKAVTDAIIKRLEADGFPCVQVGVKGDYAMPTAWKRLGLRLPLTNRLIQGAVALVDNEGFLAYEAVGLGTPAAVLFNVTPYEIYGFAGNRNLIPGIGKWGSEDAPDKRLVGTPRRCPMGTCFWGGQWTCGEGWGQQCRLNQKECLSWPRPAEAAAIVAEFVAEKAGGRA